MKEIHSRDMMVSQHNLADSERDSRINNDTEIESRRASIDTRDTIINEIEMTRHTVMISNINTNIPRSEVESRLKLLFKKLL